MAYAQARIQSRHGARPDARAWAVVHASVTLASLLENARASSLECWIAGLDPGATRAEAESLLQVRLRERISEAARWMPDAWRPAMLRTKGLLELPERQRELRESGDEERAAAVRRDWVASWRNLWPDCGAEDREALEELVRAIESHLAGFEHAAPDDAEAQRQVLRLRVETLFRRHALSPAAAFDHLVLVALEAERLRAEVMARMGTA